MVKENAAPDFSVLLKLWPFLFVPATLYAVKTFGHTAGNLLLGALFFYLAAFRTDSRTRKLMIILAVFSGLFETANVAAKAYAYHGSLTSPLWISLGWAILGWWVLQVEPELKRTDSKTSFAAASALMVAAPFLNQTLSLSTPIGIAGLYVLSLTVGRPFAIYAFVSAFAVIAEFSGTLSGVWTYYDLAGSPIPPDLASLALVYPVVLAFCFWLSGHETAEKTKSPQTA